ncbi:MAG: hypothetical protein WC798_01800 [Candidatus Paceibacterota bacterium]|jgi:hypothetical protein
MPRALITSFAILTLALGSMGAYAPVVNAAPAAQADAKTVDGTNKPKVETPQQQQDDAYNSVMIKIMGLFAWLLGVAVITLDYAVYYTVVKMGSYINSLSAIGVAWRILRDLGNIALIFGFLAIGINTILGENYYGWGQKLLPKLLIVAVFINFSLFISEAVIDTGNLFATQFYTQINGGVLPTADSLSGKTLQNIQNEGISNKIMAQLGMQNIYSDALVNKAVFQGPNPWFIGFMGILLFIVAAFVMFSLAFILIARFVALVFVIILSPLGLAGLAIPNLSGVASQWWDTLVKQTITAPVLLLMLYIALAVITDVQFLTGLGVEGASAGAATGFINGANLAGFAGFILSFLVAMGLLLVVTIYAKKLSAFGAGWATKAAGTVVGGAVGYGLVGGASLVGRGTFGLAGRALNNKGVQARAAGGGFGGALAKGFAFTGRKLENRTYDLRNVKTVGRVGGAISGALSSGQLGGSGFEAVGGGMGKGATVTAKQAVDKTIEGYKYIKPFSGDWWRDQQKEYEKSAAERDRKKVVADSSSPEFVKTIKKMSADELSELKGIRGALDKYVTALSPAKYSELQKSDKLLKSEKGNLKTAWNERFSSTNAASTLSTFTPEEIASLDADILKRPEVASNLGVREMEAIRNKKTLDMDQRRAVHATIQAQAASDPAYKATIDAYFADPKNNIGSKRKEYWDV